MMLTAGIDLASQAKNTAICIVRWRDGGAHVERVTCPADDEQILAACRDADASGIDAPFGWPDPFVRLLASGENEAQPWDDERRDALRLRRTDVVAHERVRRQPLSVSADRIALAALRARSLLARHGVTDRSGADGRVFEVWPAGFRRAVGWDANKKQARVDAGSELDRVRAALPWLVVSPDAEEILCTKGAADNAVDALVASLATRAAALGNTDVPAPGLRATAAREGWIHLPKRGLSIDAALGIDR